MALLHNIRPRHSRGNLFGSKDIGIVDRSGFGWACWHCAIFLDRAARAYSNTRQCFGLRLRGLDCTDRWNSPEKLYVVRRSTVVGRRHLEVSTQRTAL